MWRQQLFVGFTVTFITHVWLINSWHPVNCCFVISSSCFLWISSLWWTFTEVVKSDLGNILYQLLLSYIQRKWYIRPGYSNNQSFNPPPSEHVKCHISHTHMLPGDLLCVWSAFLNVLHYLWPSTFSEVSGDSRTSFSLTCSRITVGQRGWMDWF